MKLIKNFKIKKLALVCFLFIFPLNCYSKMGSENFNINADVIGIGGNSGDSENYNLTDTVGETVIGISDSENYSAKQGFWQMLGTGISLTIDSDSVNLGHVSPGNSVEGQSVLNVITDSWGGYDVYIRENHSLLHNDSITTINDYSCNIDNPCTWVGYGFGFTVKSGTGIEEKWGVSPDYSYSAVPFSATKFHYKGGYSSGTDQTTVGYKLVAPSAQKSGSYSNIITYIVTEKL